MIEVSQAVLDRVEGFCAAEGIPPSVAVQVVFEIFSDLRPRQRQLLVDARVAGTDEDWRTVICHVGHGIERADEANGNRRRRYEKGSF